MIWLMLLLLAPAAVAGDRPVVVDSAGSLQAALRNQSVHTIFLKSTINLSEPETPSVLPINRNVTISGGPGGVHKALVLHAKLDLCSTCTLTLTNLDLVNNQRGDEQAVAAGSSQRLNPDALAAVVVVPVVVVGLLAASVGIWCIRRQRHQLPEQKRHLHNAADGDDDIEQQRHHEQHQKPNQEPRQGRTLDSSSLDYSQPLSVHSDSIEDSKHAGTPDWTLSGSCTSPLLGQVEDTRIEFGELLGAAAFGSVYKGHFAGREVVVRVIQHDTSSMASVQRVAGLLMSFDAPNVVRALHYATYINDQDPAAAGTTGTPHTSGPRGPGSSIFNQAASQEGSQHCAPAPSSASTAADHGVQGCSSRTSAVLGLTAKQQQLQQHVSACEPAGSELQLAADKLGAAGGALGGSAVGGNSQSTDNSLEHSAVLLIEGSEQQQPLEPPASAGGCVPAGNAAECVRKAVTHLVLEYCDVGTLAAVAEGWRNEQGQADEHMLELLVLLKDVAAGLQVLHSQDVVLADLSAHKILVSGSENAPFGLVAKLSDIGISRAVRQQQTQRSTAKVGALSHQSPEMLQHGHVSPAADIYSFGIMMWTLFTNKEPFKKLQYGQFYDYVVLQHLRPIVPSSMPADYQLLMESCWASSPGDRPSIVRVLDCLDAMIEERALQAAAEEVKEAEDAEEEEAGMVLAEQQVLPAAAAAVAPSTAATSAPSFTAHDKMKKRSALLALLSSGGRQRRASGVQTHVCSAVSPRSNSEPLPPVLMCGRGGSASSAHSGFNNLNLNLRHASETWLLQRSPASFSAGFGTPGFSVFSSSFSASTNPPLMMVGHYEEEEGSCATESAADGAADSPGEAVEGCQEDAKAVAASTAEDYFWVV